ERVGQRLLDLRLVAELAEDGEGPLEVGAAKQEIVVGDGTRVEAPVDALEQHDALQHHEVDLGGGQAARDAHQLCPQEQVVSEDGVQAHGWTSRRSMPSGSDASAVTRAKGRG